MTDTSSIQKDKQQLRDVFVPGSTSLLSGKAAEQVRRLPGYRQVRQMFVSPDPELQQIRINCLVDRKELIMSYPALKEGFLRITPSSVPFRDLGYAVSLKGLAKYGKKLDMAAVHELDIELFVTTCITVDRSGNQLGDGNGFFDLSCGLLAEQGGVRSDAAVCTVVGEQQIVERALPCAPWDVKADFIVTSSEIITTSVDKRSPGLIYWEFLPEKRIRKITPLWQLHQQKRVT